VFIFANRATYPDPPPVVPVPESIAVCVECLIGKQKKPILCHGVVVCFIEKACASVVPPRERERERESLSGTILDHGGMFLALTMIY